MEWKDFTEETMPGENERIIVTVAKDNSVCTGTFTSMYGMKKVRLDKLNQLTALDKLRGWMEAPDAYIK